MIKKYCQFSHPHSPIEQNRQSYCLGLAGVAQFVGMLSSIPKGNGLDSRRTCLVSRFGPWLGNEPEATDQCFSPMLMFLLLSLSLSLSL